jgi:hypothetical protein
MELIETGVMIMKNGKAWGCEYDDGHSTSYGWIDPCKAPIHDPKYCKKQTDVTYSGSHYTKELMTGKVVMVIRKTTVIEVSTVDAIVNGGL